MPTPLRSPIIPKPLGDIDEISAPPTQRIVEKWKVCSDFSNDNLPTTATPPPRRASFEPVKKEESAAKTGGRRSDAADSDKEEGELSEHPSGPHCVGDDRNLMLDRPSADSATTNETQAIKENEIPVPGAMRQAVSLSMAKRKVVEPEIEGGVMASTDIFIGLEDCMREFIEEHLKMPELLKHNQDRMSLNELMRFARSRSLSREFAAVVQRCPIVSRQAVDAAKFRSAMSDIDDLRLRSREKRYQRSLRDTEVLRKMQWGRDEFELPEGLAFELRGSVAMGLSLISTLFLSFLTGFYGIAAIGYDNLQMRAISGLLLLLATMAVEVGLILVRYAKLDRVRSQYARKH